MVIFVIKYFYAEKIQINIGNLMVGPNWCKCGDVHSNLSALEKYEGCVCVNSDSEIVKI